MHFSRRNGFQPRTFAPRGQWRAPRSGPFRFLISQSDSAFPPAGGRWAIAGLLGAFHGLYFLLFLQSTGYAPGFVLLGAALAEAVLIALFALVFARLGRLAAALRPVQVSASALLVIGMVWFFLRL